MSPTIYRKYKYFNSTVQTAEDRRQKLHFCRLPFAVNVMLNLSKYLAIFSRPSISGDMWLSRRDVDTSWHRIQQYPVNYWLSLSCHHSHAPGSPSKEIVQNEYWIKINRPRFRCVCVSRDISVPIYEFWPFTFFCHCLNSGAKTT